MTIESPEYTVAVCNYNMADTLEESLKSILAQIDERFEVLVIDDGSTDGSQEILSRLDEEYEALRWKIDSNDTLGETRAVANEEARGDHIIVQYDSDDRIKQGAIQGLVKIYEKLNEKKGGPVVLGNIGPKNLLTEKANYRPLERGGDRDWMRRIAAEDAWVHLEHENYFEPIGYDYNRWDKLRHAYKTPKVIFRAGITWRSYVKWKLKTLEYRDDLLRIFISPFAKLNALLEGTYEMPGGYDDFGKFEKERREKSKTLSELEEEYGFDLNDELSEESKEIFY
jgi:glycosyltransferase involved in cell wall biosynthesis